MAIARARFAYEGEVAVSRPYQQSTTLVVRAEDWARYPWMMVRIARELKVISDLVSDPRQVRYGGSPCQFSPVAVDANIFLNAPFSPGLKAMLHALLPETTADDPSRKRGIVFGRGDFADEKEFFDRLGEALEILRHKGFRHWQDMPILSGIDEHGLGGLSLAYRPSAPARNAAPAIDEQNLRTRLEWAPAFYDMSKEPAKGCPASPALSRAPR